MDNYRFKGNQLGEHRENIQSGCQNRNYSLPDWEVVRIKRAKGGYAKIRAHEKRVTLRYKDDDEKWKKLEMREVIVTDNGREKPMFIITTDFEHSMKDINEVF